MISFSFYSTCFKIYIHLPCINTQRLATATFDDTSIISYSDRRKTGLYQGSADRCKVDRNSDIIRLLQQSQAIHYCNKSVLAIFPDLNIFLFSITILISFREAPWNGLVYYVQAICITRRGQYSTSFFRNQHRVFVIVIVTCDCTILLLRKYGFKVFAVYFCFYPIRLLS